ncbi:MAG: sortase [Roseiflexus castenholzii]|uniref:sortase n=1 Tax=Roseiflexus castenholzii TaxID=120962 RepID=UPI000CA964BA|nr:MAG: sortase [Roseiflexus castenholzii]
MTTQSDDETLLETLINAPLPPARLWQKPAVLRSLDEHRHQVLSGYRLRTWVDRWLHRAERLFGIAALLIFGWWVVDGPVRDWWYAQQVTRHAPPVESAPRPMVVVRPPATVERVIPADVPLPFTTPDMRQSPAEGFLAPRSPVEAVEEQGTPLPRRLIIPAIGLDTPVVEVFIVDGAWQVADYAAGYLHGTGLPGDPGNLALAGHAGLRGAVFRDLGRLTPGADIFVDAGTWRYQYRVRDMRDVWPTDVDVLDPTPTPTITLITCTNWDIQRLIVIGDLVGAQPLTGE